MVAFITRLCSKLSVSISISFRNIAQNRNISLLISISILKWFIMWYRFRYWYRNNQFLILISILVSKSAIPIIDIDIGFEINGYPAKISISNPNEQFRTTLPHPCFIMLHQCLDCHPCWGWNNRLYYWLFVTSSTFGWHWSKGVLTVGKC